MGFISNFWAAYVPVGVVVVAAVVELLTAGRKERTPPPSPNKRERASGRAVVFYMAWPRASSGPRRSRPVGAMAGRVISLEEARRRRSQAPGESAMRRSRA